MPFFNARAKMTFHIRAHDSNVTAQTPSNHHLEYVGFGLMLIGLVQFIFTMLCQNFILSASSKVALPNIDPWQLMTVQTTSIWHLWCVAKTPIPKFPLFLKLDHFALGFSLVHLKIDLLHWPFLMNFDYAPWKYMSNGVCS